MDVVQTMSSRLLTLLSLLQSRRDWPGPLLADRLEISARTVRRDVDRLRALGYPIAAVKGPDGGYRLEAGTELPPLLFDDEQAVAVAVALQSVTSAGTGIEEAAVRALGTVRQVMPARLRRQVDAVQVTALQPVGATPPPPVHSATLLSIGDAIRAQETLRFDYDAPEPAAPAATRPREVEPHHLVTWNGRWYLVAFDPGRDDWRTFRVDRITPREARGRRFAPREIPGGDLTAYVSSKFRGARDHTGRWPCVGEVIVHRPAAELVPYVGDAVLEVVDDVRCRLTVGSWSWPALAAKVAGFDAEIDVEGPAQLGDAFGVLAARAARAARSAKGLGRRGTGRGE